MCSWIFLQDISDAQWRNFRENLPILTVVLGFFTIVANILRYWYNLKGRGMSFIWILTSLSYLSYLHGAWYASWSQELSIYPLCASFWLLRWLITYLCSVGYIISIASLNFFMAKVCAFAQCYVFLALFNIFLVLKLDSFWYTSLRISVVQEWVNHDISKSHIEGFFMFFYLSNYWWTLDCSFYIIFISSKQYNIYIVRHEKSYESIHYVWPFNMLTLCS